MPNTINSIHRSSLHNVNGNRRGAANAAECPVDLVVRALPAALFSLVSRMAVLHSDVRAALAAPNIHRNKLFGQGFDISFGFN